MRLLESCSLFLAVALVGGCKRPTPQVKQPASVPLSALLVFAPGHSADDVRAGLKTVGPVANYNQGMIYAHVSHPWFGQVQISTDSDTGSVSSWNLYIRHGALTESNREAFADAIENSNDLLRGKRKVMDDQVLETFHYEFGHATDSGTDLASLDPNPSKAGGWSGVLNVCSAVRGSACETIIRSVVSTNFPEPSKQ